MDIHIALPAFNLVSPWLAVSCALLFLAYATYLCHETFIVRRWNPVERYFSSSAVRTYRTWGDFVSRIIIAVLLMVFITGAVANPGSFWALMFLVLALFSLFFLAGSEVHLRL